MLYNFMDHFFLYILNAESTFLLSVGNVEFERSNQYQRVT